MFEDVIVDQNPHWDGSLFEQGVPRHCLDVLKEKYLGVRQVISIVGVRRCGKSTLLRQIINFLIQAMKIDPENILFMNLENPYFTPYRDDVRNLEQIYADYLKLVGPRKGKVYIFLDELQFFRDWQVFVKAHYENDNIKFIVTGSNSQLLSSDLLTLLSGRTLPLTLYPFDFPEYVRARGETVSTRVQLVRRRHVLRRLCDEYLAEGGFPEVVLTENQPIKKDILANYAKNILFQDIVPRFEIKKTYQVEKLFFYLVSNTGSLFTYSNLAELVGISDKTAKEYVKYCADAFLLQTLDRFNFSVKKQIRSPKKVYCIDNGLVSAVSFSFSKNIGHYLENVVFGKLQRGEEYLLLYD
ncbi:MAG: AAA family ATPase [Nitrospiraceae bacterium]|nr:AAA family ATPase [Nitrospiraceae bacterium]